MADTKNLTNSNTTNVKVKHMASTTAVVIEKNSNTTNVKVKSKTKTDEVMQKFIFKYNQC